MSWRQAPRKEEKNVEEQVYEAIDDLNDSKSFNDRRTACETITALFQDHLDRISAYQQGVISYTLAAKCGAFLSDLQRKHHARFCLQKCNESSEEGDDINELNNFNQIRGELAPVLVSLGLRPDGTEPGQEERMTGSHVVEEVSEGNNDGEEKDFGEEEYSEEDYGEKDYGEEDYEEDDYGA